MAASLYPAFVRLDYHSAYGPHTMTIPTRDYDETGDEFTNWDDLPVDSAVMIGSLVAAMVPFFIPTTVFDRYTIWKQDTPTSNPYPVKTANLSDAGTSPSTEWTKASQVTWSFRTTEFGTMKLVMLDAVTEGNWDKITSASINAAQTTLIEALTNPLYGWSGRDNARPDVFMQVTYTLNEALRRAYRMT